MVKSKQKTIERKDSNFNRQTEIDQNIKELVKARLSLLPKNVGICIGSKGDFKRDELIEHVDKGDEVGKQIIKVEMDFLRSLKTGEIYENIFSYEA